MSGSEVYEMGAAILVRDQYQPFASRAAIFDRYSADGREAWVVFRNSAMAAWIEAAQIIGRDTAAGGQTG